MQFWSLIFTRNENKARTDTNNGWQMIEGMENLSYERNYRSLIKVRLRGDMTAIYKYTGEGSRNGEEELFKPKVNANTGQRYINKKGQI